MVGGSANNVGPGLAKMSSLGVAHNFVDTAVELRRSVAL